MASRLTANKSLLLVRTVMKSKMAERLKRPTLLLTHSVRSRVNFWPKLPKCILAIFPLLSIEMIICTGRFLLLFNGLYGFVGTRFSRRFLWLFEAEMKRWDENDGHVLTTKLSPQQFRWKMFRNLLERFFLTFWLFGRLRFLGTSTT